MTVDMMESVTSSSGAEAKRAKQGKIRSCARCGRDSAAVLVAREILCGGCFLDETVTGSLGGNRLTSTRRAIDLELRLQRAISAVEWLEAILREKMRGRTRKPERRR
jgi:hypothetical protein